MNEVSELRVTLKSIFRLHRFERLKICAVGAAGSNTLMVSPCKNTALELSGYCKSEMGSSNLNGPRAHYVEKRCEALLRDIFFHQELLLLPHHSDRAMQHRQKDKNQNRLDELGIHRAKQKQITKDSVRIGG